MAMKPGSNAWNTAATNYHAMKQMGMKLTPAQEKHIAADQAYMKANPSAGAPQERKYAEAKAAQIQRQQNYDSAVDIMRGGGGGGLSDAQRAERSAAGKASAAKRRGG